MLSVGHGLLITGSPLPRLFRGDPGIYNDIDDVMMERNLKNWGQIPLLL